MHRQGVHLLQRFVQDGRVHIRRPKSQQQIPFSRKLRSGNSFAAIVDAISELDGTPCVLEWKTSSARYPREPVEMAAFHQQLICYSWMTGIDAVAQVVFVRKRIAEVLYLQTTISDEQRIAFETQVEDAVRSAEAESPQGPGGSQQDRRSSCVAAQHEQERETKFVGLGKYLCEVPAGQYRGWRT